MEAILNNKLEDSYGSTANNVNNWSTENELMVTITLNEYRDLITLKATSDSRIKKAETQYYESLRKCDGLEKQIATLKAAISSENTVKSNE